MNFILKSSLEHIALVKVAALLWNQLDIRTQVTEFSNSFFLQLNPILTCHSNIPSPTGQEWKKIENEVIERVVQLTIPSSLKVEILGYVQSVGIQIFKWMKYHLEFCCFDLDLPSEFCWNAQGTVDKKKTAEMLITDNSVDIITRYKLACLYCLEDDIPELRNKIPEGQNEFRCSQYDSVLIEDIKKRSVMEFLSFWTHVITVEDNELNNGCSTYQNLFNFAAKCGNKAATEYFLQKLDQKEEFLLNTALNVAKKHDIYDENNKYDIYYNEVLFFLISQMNYHQQIKLFQQRPYQVAYCLLQWPFQSLFVEAVVKFLWNRLPENYCILLLFQIILYELAGYKDYNYKKAFLDVWQQIPDADKNSIINESYLVVLAMRHCVEYKEDIKLIFEGVTIIQKRKLIFSERGRSLCRQFVCREKWDLVKFLIELLISSKNEMIKFKQEFQENIHIEDENAKYKGHFDQFFGILDDCIRGYDVRNRDEDESSSAKRFCRSHFKDMAHSEDK